MSNMNIALSIITVNYNNLEGLIKTVNSVVNQAFEEFEWLIIDGGSNDGSKDVIQNISDKRLQYWVSEPDTGIYNAMNKGIIRAKGEYLLFLNSGDYLAGDAVLSMVFSRHYSSDIFYGDLVREKCGVKYIVEGLDSDTIKASDFFRTSLPHQASFIKRKLFDKYGLYEEKYRIVSDWQFFLKCVVFENVTIEHIHVPISVFEGRGCSEMCTEKRNIENEDVLSSLFQPKILADYKDGILSVEEIRRFVFFRLLYSLLYRVANLYTIFYDSYICRKKILKS